MVTKQLFNPYGHKAALQSLRPVFSDDGPLSVSVNPSSSLTKMWNTALDDCRLHKLQNLAKNGGRSKRYDLTHLAYLNTDSFSSQFLQTRPDVIGVMRNELFLSAIANYLGVLDPAFASLDGQFLAHLRKEATVDDECGHALCRPGWLPGGHQAKGHKDIQRAVANLGRDAGLSYAIEPSNTFAGLVPPATLAVYDAAYAAVSGVVDTEGCIPDLRFTDFPECYDQIDIEKAPKKTGIFEVKQVFFGDSRYGKRTRLLSGNYGSSESDRAVDRRAKEIKVEYVAKARGFDCRFAGTTAGAMGPFENALDGFAYNGVVPLVTGAFGEVNAEFKNIVKTLALLAVENCTGLASDLPLYWSKSVRYSFVVSEYRRSLGTTFTKNIVNLKHLRKSFVAPTLTEARKKAQDSQLNSQRLIDRRRQPPWFLTKKIDSQSVRAWSRFCRNRMIHSTGA